MSFFLSLAVASFALSYAIASQTYYIKDAYVGHDFLRGWVWETFDDPTHGRVNYVDQATALTTNLSYASHSKFIMRADSCKVVKPSARGRDSVRIISNNAYSESITVLDLSHMPFGCGTWPAFWTLSKAGPWPTGGEIDIIEGVHLNTQNLASLHTRPGCSMQEPRGQLGETVSSNCDTNVNFNQGCGTAFKKPNSYGAGFNSVGGGWYVVERSKFTGISVWFWPRNDASVPREISQGCDKLNTTSRDWGCPEARFPIDKCDHQTFFDPHQMIFDTTFCGDWAGATYGASGCSTDASCNDFVDKNPEKFSEAYWEVNSLRVYVPT